MITAMSTLVLILVLIATTAVLRLVYLAVVGRDGYGDRRHQAPRSHPRSPFDPRTPTRLA
jgi:hypothetical protein